MDKENNLWPIKVYLNKVQDPKRDKIKMIDNEDKISSQRITSLVILRKYSPHFTLILTYIVYSLL